MSKFLQSLPKISLKDGYHYSNTFQEAIYFTMPTEWIQLINELRELQDDFIEAAQALNKSQREQSGVCGEWSPRQVIAHLTGWDKEVMRQFEFFQEGMVKAIEHDIDAFNKKSVSEREHLNWKEVLNEFKVAHEQFHRQAKSISPDEISGNEEYINWVNVQIEHYQHHLKQLKEWVEI